MEFFPRLFERRIRGGLARWRGTIFEDIGLVKWDFVVGGCLFERDGRTLSKASMVVRKP